MLSMSLTFKKKSDYLHCCPLLLQLNHVAVFFNKYLVNIMQSCAKDSQVKHMNGENILLDMDGKKTSNDRKLSAHTF